MRRKKRKLENAKKNSRQVATPISSNGTILTPSQEEKKQKELERKKEERQQELKRKEEEKAKERKEELEVRCNPTTSDKTCF